METFFLGLLSFLENKDEPLLSSKLVFIDTKIPVATKAPITECGILGTPIQNKSIFRKTFEIPTKKKTIQELNQIKKIRTKI